jgi:hypothetical protein
LISGNSSFSGFIVLSKVMSLRLHWLDHESMAVAVHDRSIARQFELDGNAGRLVAAITEQSDAPLFSHGADLRGLPRI